MELKEQGRWEVWVDCNESGLMELTQYPVTSAEAREIVEYMHATPGRDAFVFSTGYMHGSIEHVYSSITLNDDAVILTREDAPRPYRVTTYLNGEIDCVACFRSFPDAERNYGSTIDDLLGLAPDALPFVSIKECSR